MTTTLPATPAPPEVDVLHPGHFAYRHIGPRREDLAEMLQVVGYGTLDDFIDAVVPAEIRLRRPLALPPGPERARSAPGAARPRRHEPGVPVVHRHGLRRHVHAAGGPAKRAREPGLVHGLHAVSGGDRPGPARGAAQLPDDGVGPDRAQVANASLLDEATAAAEAMHLTLAVSKAKEPPVYLVGRALPPADDRGAYRRGPRRAAYGSRWGSPRPSASGRE